MGLTNAPPMAFVLIIQPPEGEPICIDTEQVHPPFVIGRDSDEAQVAIPDPQASRAHCRVELGDGGLVVEDLGSRNGTWRNGERVTRCMLRPGDTLRVGGSQLYIEEPEQADPLVGTKIGNYELQEALGSGSYGTVYRALQINLGRPVAVKVLSQECAKDPARVQSFLVEARRAGRLNHPNLVQVHDVLEEGGRYFLVMELMAACSLSAVKDEGPLGETHIIAVLRDICRALAYAENQRLVHRDVKPDNILLTEDGVYRLADLGIAAPMSSEGIAQTERVFGSPHYVAPEQARGGGIDSRADLYALGASVWQLATGQTVFSGTSRQLVAHHIGTPIPDLRKLAPKLSPPVVQFIVNLLDKDPARRPPTAAEALRRIERIHAAHAVRMSTPRPPMRRPLRRIRPRRR
jgi:serine/threonine protein kinase